MRAPQSRVGFLIAEGITGNADAGLWRILLDNLVGNARKYSANSEDTVIEFGVNEVEGKPACFVRDNGPGFDTAFADSLFAFFQWLPGSDVEENGIGLATVDRAARPHRGRGWAVNEP